MHFSKEGKNVDKALFLKNLIKIRKEKGFTQKQAAKACIFMQVVSELMRRKILRISLLFFDFYPYVCPIIETQVALHDSFGGLV